MLVSQTAEYALRAMAYLANLPEGEGARAQDVSAATAIPLHYAAKVLRRLANSGLLIGQKGHGGGFRLARPAEEIAFGDVLAATNEGVERDVCAFGWGKCSSQNPCPLHPAVSELRQAASNWAKDTTLADVQTARLAKAPRKKGA